MISEVECQDILFDPSEIRLPEIWSITDRSINNLSEDELDALLNWLENDAKPTIDSLRMLHREEPDAIPELLAFLKDSPKFKILYMNGKKYILSHAGLRHYEPEKRLDDYITSDLLWFRPELTTRYDSVTVVFGHTPVASFGPEYEDRMLKTDTWIDIDTGAAHGRHPMLLRLDDERASYVGE